MSASPEGIPWRDYRWRDLVAALPCSLPICLYWWALERTTRRTHPGFVGLPDDAILFTFHKNLHPLAIDKIMDGEGVRAPFLVGYHGFLSYLFSALWAFVHKMEVARYRPDADTMPLEQIVDALGRRPGGRMVMFTDSFGPYGVVRPTLISLAVKSGRPLVALEYRLSRSVTLMGHSLPLPFSTLEARFSRPVTAGELRGLPKAEAKALLQGLVDRL